MNGDTANTWTDSLADEGLHKIPRTGGDSLPGYVPFHDIWTTNTDYAGFDTTFTFLARGTYSFATMNWLLVKVFFGSGYLGFVGSLRCWCFHSRLTTIGTS